MNPLANLCGKKFKELNPTETLQVVYAYIDQNKYPDLMGELPDRVTREDILVEFEWKYSQRDVLKEFFKYWTK
jgi:hypothetical protein